MASTFSSPGDYASSSLVVPKRYDVFISFRGEDTRSEFTSHLHAALRRNNIETYIDYRIQKGEQVWKELLKAIKDSTLFLVIFSKNYASSSWCLNELVELMECKKQQQQDVHVIPVFYKVDPSHVRKQDGCYHAAFAEHKKDGKVSEEKMQQWKNALYKAANLSGFHSKGYRTENDLIEGIIKTVSEKLNHKYINTFTSHFIYDENYTNIESLLKMNSKKVRVIGIWGMGGIGKTSLATAIFRNVSSQYEGTCFLANVTEESKRHGLNYLCNKLLSKLLGEAIDIDTTNVIPCFVARRLMRKKVLIVLDDVNTSRLLVKLLGENRDDLLGAGSIIIVTTRDKQVLISGNVEKIHEVKLMNSQNSLKLFSLKAFHNTYPKKGYEELSNRAINYAKGIPLALEVLGSFLHSKRQKNEWDSALLKLEKIPNGEIQEVLKLSLDGLDHCEKKIFLDIACFFNGEERDHVTKILNACDVFADIGIARLLEKALITTNSCKNRIEMHKLIQEMGKNIVLQESPENPGQRSRLWDPEDVYDVLTNNSGTNAVEVIWLDKIEIEQIKAFRKMPNLRLLVFGGESGRIKSLVLRKKLRYFGWDGCSLESLPSLTFCAENLLVLRIGNSNVKRLWQGVQNFPNLEHFNLTGCKHLVECPNLSGAPKLKILKMTNTNVKRLWQGVQNLPNLEYFYLSGCKHLVECSNLSGAPELKFVNLSGCKSLSSVDPSIFFLENVVDLRMTNSNVKRLWQGVQNLPNLWRFELRRCKHLVECPNLSGAPKLQFVNLIECESLSSIDPSIFSLPELRSLDLLGCTSLKTLSSNRCVNLFGNPYMSLLSSSLQCFRLYESAKICYFLPVRSGKVRDWFYCSFTQAMFTIELPSNLLGFIFYLVASPFQSHHRGLYPIIGCECYLNTNEGERVNITSFFLNEIDMSNWHLLSLPYMTTDHVFLWYDRNVCKQIMEVIKERRVSNSGNPNLTFKFFAETLNIEECGFRWIYSLQEGAHKRSKEDSESNEQEETLPPTKKLKSEIEELRRRLEELSLHSI